MLLQFLLDRVSEAAQGSITVHYNSSVESLGMPASVDDAAGVATLRVVDTGSGGVTEFCSQRVLGCDGLNSTSLVRCLCKGFNGEVFIPSSGRSYRLPILTIMKV